MPVRPMFPSDDSSSTGAVNSVNGEQGDVVITSQSLNAQPASTVLTEISSVDMSNNSLLMKDSQGQFKATACMPAAVAWLSYSTVDQQKEHLALSQVASSGSYNDLEDVPELFSGDYNDLSNKPSAVSVPTRTSELTNDSGFLTSVPPQVAQVNADWTSTSGVSQILNKPTLFSGAYSDLSGKPILFSGNYTDLVGKPTLFSGSYADLTNKPVLFDGTYSSLTGKPTTFTPSSHTHAISDVTGLQTALDSKISTGASIPYSSLTNAPVIPTNTNQLTNGSGYITNSALSGYALTSSLSNYATTASLTAATSGLRKVETFLGTSDASGNITITFANTYTIPPDVQPQIIGGTFNQMVRVVSVSNTGCVVQAAQRNLVTLLSVEVLLGATVALVGASVTVQVTPRN
jgi:hypothetical protein